MAIQGIKIGMTVLCFVLALTTLNVLGVSAAAGLDPNAGGLEREDAGGISDSFRGMQVEGIGQQDPGFIGFAFAIWTTANQLWVLVTKTSAVLQSWMVPAVIAWSVQIVVDITFALGLYQLARAVKL